MNKLPPLLDKAIKQLMRTQVKRLKPTMLQKRRFYAAWLMLAYTKHNFPLKAIAKKAKVSYQLLRDWRTEEGFKELVDSLTITYARQFIETLETGNIPVEYHESILEEEFPYYSQPLNKTIASVLVERMKAVEPTPDSSPEQDRRCIHLTIFSMFMRRYRVDRWGSKKERLALHETSYELTRKLDETLCTLLKKAIEDKDFPLAQEIFDTTINILKGQSERLYQLEKTLIEHNWREN